MIFRPGRSIMMPENKREREPRGNDNSLYAFESDDRRNHAQHLGAKAQMYSACFRTPSAGAKSMSECAHSRLATPGGGDESAIAPARNPVANREPGRDSGGGLAGMQAEGVPYNPWRKKKGRSTST